MILGGAENDDKGYMQMCQAKLNRAACGRAFTEPSVVIRLVNISHLSMLLRLHLHGEGYFMLNFCSCSVLYHAELCLTLLQVGWFPEYTITEDYALSMELKMAGFSGRYLPEYLAVGCIPCVAVFAVAATAHIMLAEGPASLAHSSVHVLGMVVSVVFVLAALHISHSDSKLCGTARRQVVSDWCDSAA